MPSAVALAAVALIGAQAAAAPAPEPPSAPEAGGPEAAAMSAVLDVCLVGLAGSQSPAEYAANSDQIGRDFAAQHADAKGVSVQGYDGRACRVVYSGPHGGQVFARIAGLVAVPGCEPSEVSDTVVRSRCTLPNSGPAGSVEILRTSQTDQAAVTTTVLFVPPAGASDAIPTARH
jgi:hypothetical protein